MNCSINTSNKFSGSKDSKYFYIELYFMAKTTKPRAKAGDLF
ncbi:hypothetical protein [Chryseobacterium taihuense]|uniref:Uncharacterized protein n=1 Tax=Chryseobacterium taihuense TaxID=1141221 RepID=A0ABY0QZQ5_9FLAO|nr:hypothetical protein [Chryseobacterium taihuense]SDM14448.1 hypothetical protein SAMN05216273_11482 [Chryseobacterium taihuense]